MAVKNQKRPMRTPVCGAYPEHGPMEERGRVSDEQRWCGVWFDCGRCASSVLFPSQELKEHLEAAEGAAEGKTGVS